MHVDQQRRTRKKAPGRGVQDFGARFQIVFGLGPTGGAVETLSDLGVEWSNKIIAILVN